MKFQVNVKLNDQDYLDYNVFWAIRSHYGKKQIRTLRITVLIIYSIFVFISLFSDGFSAESFLGVIPMSIVFVLFQLFLKRLFAWALKGTVKNLKKSGKMGYSPDSVIEFYEESFAETTSENRTENKYSAIERISIVDNKIIYIHINNVMAYILPLTCFESKEQYDSFFEFINTKCEKIDVY